MDVLVAAPRAHARLGAAVVAAAFLTLGSAQAFAVGAGALTSSR
jgi:hypothetical protein